MNWRRKIFSHAPLFFIFACYFILIISFSSYVPMWDAWEYVDTWMYRAVSLPFNVFNFDFGSHVSFFYSFLISIPGYFNFGNTYFLYFWIAVFIVFSALAFYSILFWVFPEKKKKKEFYLLLILYLFFPVSTASIFQINPDTGVMIFFLLFLAFLIKMKYFWAFLSGIFLVFSKETGTALYIFTLILFFLYCKVAGDKRETKLVNILKLAGIFSMPLFLFFLNIIGRTFLLKQGFQLHRFGSLVNSQDLSSFSSITVSRLPFSYFLTIFVLNFNWVLSFFLFFGLLILGIRWLSFFKKKEMADLQSLLPITFITVLFGGAFVIMNLYKTFTNPRYFLPLYPLIIILFYYGLGNLLIKNNVKKVVLVVVVLIFLLANFSSLDPISRKIFGTFKFGNHDVFIMTKITEECCGYGRDQLVYNLQYINIHYLVNKIFFDLKPDKNTSIVFTSWEGPYVLVRMDNNTYERTLRKSNALEIDNNVRTWNFDSLPVKPVKLYFFDFPNNDSSYSLSYYLNFYSIEKAKIYDYLGYQMKVYSLKLKNNS